MKTLVRILIIVAVFVVAMGLTYVGVTSAASSSTGAPQFENRERPEFPGGEFEGRKQHEEGGGGLIFGLIKNVGIVAILVVIIVVPTNLNKRKRLQTSASSGV